MANITKSRESEAFDDSDCYNMKHKNRGFALIFNHMDFQSSIMAERTGTDKDAADLKHILNMLEFETKIHDEKTISEIRDILDEVSKMDHSDNDCLVVIVLTHGDTNILYAYDQPYNISELWTPFYSDSCPTLEGKPKLFFIQACRGDSYDYGVEINQNYGISKEMKKDKPPNSVRIADMVVMNSSYSGFYSFRHPESGSWFIQTLCKELEKRSKNKDLLSILTSVANQVAHGKTTFSDDNRLAKQMPTFFATLTKELYLTPKV